MEDEFQRIIKQIQNGFQQQRDKYYPDIPIHPMMQTEKMFIKSAGASHNEVEAMTLGVKAEIVLDQGNIEQATEMAYQAFKLSPKSDDAYRVLAKLSTEFDPATGVHMILEMINMKRKEWLPLAKESPGCFYNHAETRRFMRLIWDLAALAETARHIDLACCAYEEIIRLNHGDNMGARKYILPLYIRIMGISRRGIKCIKRDITHMKAIMNASLQKDVDLYDSDSLVIRWAKIFIAWYEKKKDFERTMMMEYGRTQWLTRFLLGEIRAIPQAAGAPKGYESMGYLVGNDQDESRVLAPLLAPAFALWPDFLGDVFRAVRPLRAPPERPLPEFINVLERGQRSVAVAEALLAKGREFMRREDLEGALEALSISRGTYGLFANYERKRWHEAVPYQVVSNRATVAEASGDIFLARFDSRVTLAMKPDHARTYARIPRLLREFGAGELADEAEALLEEVSMYSAEGHTGEEAAEEWKEFARRGIFLLSVPAIIYSMEDELTPGRRSEIMETGINDIYAPVNWEPAAHPILPFLKRNEIDNGF